MKLHIGGKEVREGWTLVNIQPGPGVDVVADCRELSMFADATAKEIYASHVLEHLSYQNELDQALREMRRVLQPGGLLYLSTPDFESLCRMFLDPQLTTEQRFHVMRMAFGGQTDPYDFHKAGLTMEFLVHFLAQAGFTKVKQVAEFKLFNDASSLTFAGRPVSVNLVAVK